MSSLAWMRTGIVARNVLALVALALVGLALYGVIEATQWRLAWGLFLGGALAFSFALAADALARQADPIKPLRRGRRAWP